MTSRKGRFSLSPFVKRMDKTKYYKFQDKDELFGYMRLEQSQSGLPIDIFVDDCKSYKSWNHPFCIMVRISVEESMQEYLPITVSAHPTILDPSLTALISKGVLRLIKKFIENNRILLYKLSHGYIEHIKFVDSIIKPTNG